MSLRAVCTRLLGSKVLKYSCYSGKNTFVRPFVTTTRKVTEVSGAKIQYVSRTSTTNILWGTRTETNNDSNTTNSTTSFLITKSPSESYSEVILPFASDIALREQYLSPYGHIRFGRILEDLDALAGNIAFLHSEDNNPATRPLTIVTASVDRIFLLGELNPLYDLRMSGNVTWVGRSSMEIRIEVTSHRDYKESSNDPGNAILVAYFTMAARDAITQKAAPVNSLKPSTPLELQRFQQGEVHKQKRLQFAEKALTRSPPTPDERLVIHDLFMLSKSLGDHTGAIGRNDDVSCSYVFMSTTKNQTVILCQPQERNMHNKIFGGYLMRKGFEVAFSTAYLFCKSLPNFFAMDDVTFYKPVEIGDILTLEATVCYTSQNTHGISAKTILEKRYSEDAKKVAESFVQVEVIACVTSPQVGKKHMTNIFNFTFVCADKGNEQVTKRVMPQTYEEAMKYLEGKRRVDRHMEFLKEHLQIPPNVS